MTKVRISIIIPCYNQGHFLRETLESVALCDKTLYELIIVNDGSTDEATNEFLRSLQKEGFNVIFQENKGLAGARNAGINQANGEFILPLDSDNKIRPIFLTEGIKLMDSNPDIAVVYGNAQYFGEKTGVWEPGNFNLQKLMISNYIDACALIRKSVLDKVGFYDTNMQYMGWEDWEMWLRLSSKGYKLQYLPLILFDYRVVVNSMSKQVYNTYKKPNTLENYVNLKYPYFMGHDHIYEFVTNRFKAAPIKFIIKLFLKTYFPAYYKKLLAQNKIRNGI